MNSSDRIPWRVLLIAGCSGSGKTTIGRALSHRTGVGLLMVDDLRLAVQYMTPPSLYPALHYFLHNSAVWSRSPEELRDGLIEVARILEPALLIAMAHHISVDASGPVILEGDGIQPSLAAPGSQHAGPHGLALTIGAETRFVLLDEHDEAVLLRNMHSRRRGFERLPTDEQLTQLRTSYLYGRWLHEEALAAALPIVPARPYDTAVDRILAVLGEPPP